VNKTIRQLQEIGKRLQQTMEAMDTAREKALIAARQLTRASANAIRAVHREEFTEAAAILSQAEEHLHTLQQTLKEWPSIYYSGFAQDAQKEYAEARLTYAFLQDNPLPTPEELGVEPAPYLNGLAEATGELRRHIVDAIRQGRVTHSERWLAIMDEIYCLLVTFDYPDAVSLGLKRRLDLMRGVLERTRSDLTTALQAQEVREALAQMEKRLIDH